MYKGKIPKDFRGLLQFLKPKLQEEREQLHTLYNQLHEKSPTLPKRLLNILKHRGRRSPAVIITPSEFREISKKAFFTISMKIAEGIRRELFPPKKSGGRRRSRRRPPPPPPQQQQQSRGRKKMIF